MVLTTFYVLWPIADVLIVVEDQVLRAGHVVLPLAFAHVVHGAVSFVRVVGYVAVFLFAYHFVGCEIMRHKLRFLKIETLILFS